MLSTTIFRWKWILQRLLQCIGRKASIRYQSSCARIYWHRFLGGFLRNMEAIQQTKGVLTVFNKFRPKACCRETIGFRLCNYVSVHSERLENAGMSLGEDLPHLAVFFCALSKVRNTKNSRHTRWIIAACGDIIREAINIHKDFLHTFLLRQGKTAQEFYEQYLTKHVYIVCDADTLERRPIRSTHAIDDEKF